MHSIPSCRIESTGDHPVATANDGLEIGATGTAPAETVHGPTADRIHDPAALSTCNDKERRLLTDISMIERVKAVGAVKWLPTKNFVGNNFHYWLKAIRNHLKAARLWEIVTGTEIRPSAPVESAHWDHLNRLAVTVLMDSIRDDLLLGVTGEESAAVIWETICNKYLEVKWGTSASLLGKLTNLKMASGSDVNEHLTVFREYSEKLNEMGEGLKTSQLTALLLGSLPDSWNTFKTSFWILKSAPSYDELEANIRTEAARRGSELAAKRKEDKKALQGNAAEAHAAQLAQQQLDLFQVTQASASREQKLPIHTSMRRVNTASRKGHKADKCFMKRRRQNDLDQANKRAQIVESNLSERFDDDEAMDMKTEGSEDWKWSGSAWASRASTRGLGELKYEWVVDSGATHHICYVLEMFDQMEASTKSKANTVGLPNGGHVAVVGVGSVILTVKCDLTDQRVKIKLNGVLYMPKFNRNLISVRKSAKAGLKFNFETTEDHLVVMSNSQSITVIGDPQEPLYILKHIRAKSNRLGLAQTTWPSQPCCNEAPTRQRRRSRFQSCPVRPRVGDACELGKKTRRVKLPSSAASVNRCNAKVHSDLTGPIETPALDGSRYVCLLVDSHSSFVTCYCLTKKSEFNELLVQHRAVIQNKHNLLLSELHSDNGGEFVNKQLKDFCAKEGILHSTSVPYTSQQNGKVEVRFRDVFAKARSMLIDGNLPKQLWDHAVQCAVYCLNRCPSGTRKTTAFELWHGYQPNLSAMRVFGSLCYVHIPSKVNVSTDAGRAKTKRQKLDYKAVRGIFLGYAEDRHAYKVLDCTTGQLLVSIHVTFDELDSVASQELKRKELLKLAQIHDLTFDFYSRQASQDVDFLFNGETTKDTLDDEEINALESFVQQFSIPENDLGEINLAAPHGSHLVFHNLDFSPSSSKLLKLSRLQAQSEELVRAEVEMAKAEAYSAAIPASSIPIPRNYEEAMTSKEWEHWKAAIEMELASIKSNGTWKYVKPPQDRKTLKTTWVFRVKEKCDGSIERFKARLVVKGFLQVKGLDYDEVFAPVMRLESLRTLLAIGNALDLPIDQMDIDTAFLNGTLEEEIYLDLPEGLQMKDVIKDANWEGASELTSSPSQVSCLLIKALYGLKQAPREWHKVLTTFLGGVGFEKTNVESCIYVRRLKSQLAIVAIYVDDLVVVAENDNVMAEVKTATKNRFASKDMGPINYILGIRVERDREKRIMHISQPLNAKNMLMRFDLDQARPATTPLDKVLDGSDCPSDGHVQTEAERLNHANFRQGIGSLMYLMLGTRPDLAYAVQALSRYLNNPGKSHIGKMKQVMRYVAGTIDYGLVYHGTDLNLRGYTDSDYAANPDTRRSVSGYCTYIGDCLVSWSSQCQRIVAQSTTEAEYIALAQAAKEVLFMRTLNCELGNPIATGIILHADNQPAIATATNPVHRVAVSLNPVNTPFTSRVSIVHTGSTSALRRQKSEVDSTLVICKDL
ncbi:hypothetical protein AeRB84_019465 [Aphanomyces euteiches]|nr:hypothetical protein AeRB84_019465 [Aphanomyces euteiches]